MAKKLWFYRNLRTGNFSMKEGSGGRVHPIAFATLSYVKPHVRENGRQKVLKEKRKNVHSFLLADFVNFRISTPSMVETLLGEDVEQKHIDAGMEEVTYNPYRSGEFFWKSDGKPVHYLHSAVLVNGKCLAYRSENDYDA